MATRWTKEQEMAINENGKNIIVSAGAGSGKTAVLTTRILSHIKSGVSLNNILVLTFTKAAAKEMKERIRSLLIKENLLEHLDILEQAYITTFDAYSLAIVKKYFYKLNVRPNINVGDSFVILQKKKEIIENLLLELYEKQDVNLLNFLRRFTTKDDKLLVDFIVKLTNSVNLIENTSKYLEDYLENYFSENYLNDLIVEYMDLLKDQIFDLDVLAKELYNEIEEGKLQDYLNDFFDIVYNFNSYDSIKSYFNNFKLPVVNRGSSDLAKNIKDSFSKSVKNFIETCLLFEDEKDMKNSVLNTYDSVVLILSLVQKTNVLLDEFKSQKDYYEFIDIAKLAIKLVEENEDVRKEIKNNLYEILIDEYQDTSGIQETFIKYISYNNVYMVGDIKQSIYRFRNANPYIFKSKYNDYSNNIDGLKIDLNKNFRSRSEVLEDINLIFNNLMTIKDGDADYRLEHQMNYGNVNYDKFKEDTNYHMDILAYQNEKSQYNKVEKESFIIARDIKEKLKGKTLGKNGEFRDTKYGDIAILIDKSSHFFTIKKILESQNIPVSINADISLKNSSLTKIICNIINMVNLVSSKRINKEYFYCFTSIARSFLFSYSDTFIYESVMSENCDNDIYLKALKISKLVNKASNEIIYLNILDEFEVFKKLPLVGDVYNSLVQLEFLKDMIVSLSNIGYTFNNISKHLVDILDSSMDIKYKLNTTNDNSVTLMTIHKSKGLEFSICYFPLLNTRFNIKDFDSDFAFSNKYGIIVPSYDDGGYKNILHRLNIKTALKEEVSEHIRLFYVALTRAKEKMILIYNDEEHQLKYKNSNNFMSFSHFIFSIYDNLIEYFKEINLDGLNMNRDYLNYASTNIYKSNKENLDFDNVEMTYNKIMKGKISKEVNSLLTKKDIGNISLGLEFHEILESLDFGNINFDNFKHSVHANHIKDVLKLEIFKNIKNARVYQEYEFKTIIDNKKLHGIIDLLVVYDTHIEIIDYKLSDISKEEYVRQLSIYKDYIKTKSNLRIDVYLLSILNKEVKKLDV